LKFDVEIGLLAFPKYIVKAKKLTKYVFVKSSKDNRFVFEKNKDILVYNLEDTGKRDFIHHRSSSLNQVLCGLANKNNIKVGLSFNSLLKADPIPRAKILGRMKQNIKLCNKYKVSTLVASFANKPYEMRNNKDLESFF
jgi:hypothetical protein